MKGVKEDLAFGCTKLCVPRGGASLLVGAWLSALLFVQVCDQPHPLLVAEIVRHCSRCHLDKAYKGMKVCDFTSRHKPVLSRSGSLMSSLHIAESAGCP